MRALFLSLLFLSGCTSYMPSHHAPHPRYVPQPSFFPSLSGHLVVIDPGHGGKDSGAVTKTDPPYREKDLNLTTALYLQRYLNRAGCATYMTRSKDTYLTLQRRSEIAKEQHATLFVSVHYNAAPRASAHGIEVFYHKPKEESAQSLQSERLAQTILEKVCAETEANNRGVKTARFAVLRETTTCPSILVECGFMTNSEELEKLKEPEYQRRVAKGIAAGVLRYLSQP